MEVVGLYIVSKKQRKQIEELKNRIIKDGHDLLEENEFIGKAELESLRYKVAKGRIEVIYIYSPDELSEKFADQIKLVREFHQTGAEVIFLKHKTKGLISSLLWKSQWAMEKYKYAMEWQIG